MTTAENSCFDKMIDYDTELINYSFENGQQSVSPATRPKLNFTGRAPQEGDIYVNRQCDVAIAIRNGNWCAKKNYHDQQITIEEYDGDCFFAVGGSWTFEVTTTEDNFSFSFGAVDPHFTVDWDDGSLLQEVNYSGYNNVAMFYGTDIVSFSTEDFFDEASANITDMSVMFYYAYDFNQDISNWNTSSVTNMNWMFRNAVVFNQDLSGWCVENIESSPNQFDSGADAWILPRPDWGACP